jgi:hypothetical protein
VSVSPAPSPLSFLARPDAGWSFTLCPTAGEGGGSFQRSVRRVPQYVARGDAKDPDRAVAEAGRRARSRLRRYCAANRLNRLGTLTYRGAGNHDPQLLREHLGEFFRNLRDGLGGKPLPYAWVPEWHNTHHGLHAHFAVGKYIKRRLIDEAWGHGFISIKLLGDQPVGAGALSEARTAATYLSKYVAKTFADPIARDLGLHRYDVAQGFQPERIRLTGTSARAVVDEASELMGGDPLTRWSSSENPDWRGAPAIWAQWGR